MIFSELYSAYFRTVSAILAAAVRGEADGKTLQSIVRDNAFGESALTILPRLKNGEWPLLRPDMTTPLMHEPTMPMTDLERRWLKSITLDPRFALFGESIPGLDDVKPLFTPDDFRVFDVYGNGDPYTDEGYITRFRTLLSAVRARTPMKLSYRSRDGRSFIVCCLPTGLEYSEKDDKFRLLISGCRFSTVLNLGRITDCVPYTGPRPARITRKKTVTDTVELEITDQRNALERVMLHFAHFEKQAERLSPRVCRLRVNYDRDDETEMVIRVLSFGPMVRVVGPDHFVDLIKERLKQQKSCDLKSYGLIRKYFDFQI